nr:hypothetical protein Iba_chr07dCG7030 [Ipomoea batatas]
MDDNSAELLGKLRKSSDKRSESSQEDIEAICREEEEGGCLGDKSTPTRRFLNAFGDANDASAALALLPDHRAIFC